ncbi:hypothetical protein DP939_37585 [Spongiactinospora rosea]|uniref:HTH marR-type domain-containing protein n=1 Tax=Spongiactinospora rosea TaxID=2248750 RepID=A0A366LMS4_9ACTN|nr:hypothetical protein [Spongiactinospora rosea]RBQ15117.1 hypothetical protein DP939_37585 [Spongiactinospora rosea]
MVLRVRAQRDRRACDIQLTEQGRQIAHAAHRKVTAQVEHLIGEVAPDDRERLEHVVTTIIRSAHPAPRVPAPRS